MDLISHDQQSAAVRYAQDQHAKTCQYTEAN